MNYTSIAIHVVLSSFVATYRLAVSRVFADVHKSSIYTAKSTTETRPASIITLLFVHNGLTGNSNILHTIGYVEKLKIELLAHTR